MGSKADPPPPPDYSAVAAASEESARISAEVAREQLAWARERYDLDRDLTDLVVENALDRADREDASAAEDRARYRQVFQPLEDDLVAEAESYASPERSEFEAGRAMADVSQQFNLMRSSAQDRLESFGLDPTQTRSQALDLSTRMQEAAARASAGNQSRVQTEAVGRALRSEAVNVGRGYPGQIASAYNTAIQSGNQAVNSQLATTSTAGNAMGNPAQWQSNANQATGQWWNGLNTMYGNQVDAYKAEAQASGGLGSALGLIGGIAGRAWAASDEGVKEAITPVGKLDDGQTVYKYRYKGDDRTQIGLIAQEVERERPEAVAEVGGVKMVDYDKATRGAERPRRALYAEDGGAVPDGMTGPDHSGVPVRPEQSVSRGAIRDDVPARVNVGEFIVPKDVVSWKGEEFFQKMIQGSRQAKEAAPAKPSYGPAVNERPTVNTAIPMGA